MKDKATPELSARWWKANQPKTLDKGHALAHSLEQYEDALKVLTDGTQDEAYDDVRAALEEVEDAVTVVLREAEAGVRAAERDHRIDRHEYENTVRALKKFPEQLQHARKEAESLYQEQDSAKVDALDDVESYREYLKKVMPRLKHKRLHFAFGVAKEVEDHRLVFDASRNGHHLAQALKEHVSMGKLTWGQAVALHDDERTLALHLEGPRLPGMAKGATALLHKLGGLPFSRVVLLFEGKLVPDLPEPHAEQPGETHLAESWKKLKGSLLPIIQETLAKTDSHKAEIRTLMQQALQAEKDGRLADAIHILRDQVIPHLNAARHEQS
jgi:hypothetical protein